MLCTNEADASLFTSDISIPCAFNTTPSKLEVECQEDINTNPPKDISIHFYSKHKHRDTFGDAHVQYHDFGNGDAFIYKDNTQLYYSRSYKISIGVYMTPVTTKSYQISSDVDIETMLHAMYLSSNTNTVTKVNHVPY